jgi:hypothetical protein
MRSPKHLEQRLNTYFLRIKNNLNNLRMSCGARTYLRIARLLHYPASIARIYSNDAFESQENRLSTPKAASTKDKGLLA